jgi:benzoylformate decarboxylase
MDLLSAPVEQAWFPKSASPSNAVGDVSGLAAHLQRASRVAILASDLVAQAGAVGELVRLVDETDFTVFGTPLLGCHPFPASHPSWAGTLPPDHGLIRQALEGFDTVLLLGDHALLAYPYRDTRPIAPGVAFLQIASTASRLGFDHPATIALHGDLKPTLGALHSALAGRRDADGARAQLEERQARRASERAARLSRTAPQRPLHPTNAVQAILEALPKKLPIVNEASSTFDTFRDQWQSEEADRYYFVRGGGLGFGMPAAVGVSLAGNREPVLCLVGDGASMYSPQALWSAANCAAPVTFVVVNNQKYDILMRVAKNLEFENAKAGRFVGMNLDAPAVDFAGLAKTFQLPYRRADEPDDIRRCLAEALGSGVPSILEIRITGL